MPEKKSCKEVLNEKCFGSAYKLIEKNSLLTLYITWQQISQLKASMFFSSPKQQQMYTNKAAYSHHSSDGSYIRM
jgi:hypothetical protein